MDEGGFEILCPRDAVVAVDGERVDLVEGPEVVEMRHQDIRGEHVAHADVDLSSVLEEAAFSHVR